MYKFQLFFPLINSKLRMGVLYKLKQSYVCLVNSSGAAKVNWICAQMDLGYDTMEFKFYQWNQWSKAIEDA